MSNFDLGPLFRDNNRRLKKSIGKYFERKKNKKKSPTIVKSSKRGMLSSFDKRLIKTTKYLILLSFSVFIYFVIFNSNILIGIYAKNQASIYEKNDINNKLDIYQFHIKEGHIFLERNGLDKAQKSFTLAKNMFENGKEANYGMAKCLLLQCKKQHRYCEESIEYLKKIQSSALFSGKEINELKNISK